MSDSIEVLEVDDEPGAWLRGHVPPEAATLATWDYLERAVEVRATWHGWGKSMPVRDEDGDLVPGFVVSVRKMRGAWPITRVELAPFHPREADPFPHCQHQPRPRRSHRVQA